jgi:hypothetical protein
VKNHLFCLILVAFIFGFSMNSYGSPRYTISPREKAVNKAMGRNSKMLANKYSMCPSSITVAMPGGDIQYLELAFQIQGPLSSSEIRQILIHSVHDFLADINSDVELCSYFKNPSFTIKDVGITLFLIDSSGRDLKDPEIGVAEISRGELEYYRCDPNDISINGMVGTKESYEEALKLLESQRYNANYEIPKSEQIDLERKT